MASAADVAAIGTALRLDRAMAGVPGNEIAEAWAGIETAPDEAALLMAAMRLFALAGNGHTRLIPNGAARVFPIRLVWSGGALWAGPEGRRVTHVNGLAAEELHERLRSWLAGTHARQRVIGGLPLAWPTALALIGAGRKNGAVAYRFADGGEARFGTADLGAALPLYPVAESGFPTPERDPFPAAEGVLRLSSFATADAGASERRIAGARAMLALHEGPLVVDLRGNPGGDFLRHLPILDDIERRGAETTVLVDRFTFSAAIVFAALCRARLGARLVGEEMGDGPAFWAEGGTTTLPASGAAVRHSDGWHDWEFGRATADTPAEIAGAMRACGPLQPDIHAVTTPEDIVLGRDPARDTAMMER